MVITYHNILSSALEGTTLLGALVGIFRRGNTGYAVLGGVTTMAADALAPCIAGLSAAMVLCRRNRSLSSTSKDLSYRHHFSVEYNFMFPQEYSAYQGPLDKWTIFSIVFPWIKIFEFQTKFHRIVLMRRNWLYMMMSSNRSNFPHYRSFVREIHRWLVNSPPKRPMRQIFYGFFYPRPVLAFRYCRCLRLSVCVSVRVCQPLACPGDNSWPVSARITKFGP